MRYWIIAISMLLYAALPAPVEAQVGIAFQSDDVSIGIDIPVYPTLVSIPAIRSITTLAEIRTTSSTTECIGCTRTTIGMRAPGTTGLGTRSGPSTCRSGFCASPCAITVIGLPTSVAGALIWRHVGVSIGAATGNGIVADGIDGIVAPYRTQHRCRPISASIPAGAILTKPISGIPFGRHTTGTSHATT